jgi:hypothetical protein
MSLRWHARWAIAAGGRAGALAGLLVSSLATASPGRGAPLAADANVSLAQRNRMLAAPLTIGKGWADGQWRCLDRLWTRESGWNHHARNRRSGAYGIPQALPAGKMSSAGNDWRTSAATQIRWGLGYIGKRYGNPCAAWGHSQVAGWY